MSERKTPISANCPKCGEHLKRVYVSMFAERKVTWHCTDFHICLKCEKIFKVNVKVKVKEAK